MIDVRVPRGLLGGHVRGRAQRHAHRGERPCSGRVGHRLRDPEVRHQRVSAGKQHVVGLHVAVHDAVAVGVGEGVTHVPQDPHRLPHGQLALVGESRAQRLPRDVGHDVVEQVAL